MNVSEAVKLRRSCRGFSDRPVALDLVRDVLTTALAAPSSGNLQPWRLHVVQGVSMERLRQLMRDRLAAADLPDEAAYDAYPRGLRSPYRDRRFRLGEALYQKLGVPRDDNVARKRFFAKNFDFFGAPVGLFFAVDRQMGPLQFADVGILMQTIMLLLRDKGVDSCPQGCWTQYSKTIGAFLQLPDIQMVFAGMAIGYADPTALANELTTERAGFDDIVTFVG